MDTNELLRLLKAPSSRPAVRTASTKVSSTNSIHALFKRSMEEFGDGEVGGLPETVTEEELLASAGSAETGSEPSSDGGQGETAKSSGYHAYLGDRLALRIRGLLER